MLAPQLADADGQLFCQFGSGHPLHVVAVQQGIRPPLFGPGWHVPWRVERFNGIENLSAQAPDGLIQCASWGAQQAGERQLL